MNDPQNARGSFYSFINPISALSVSADPLQWDISHVYGSRSGSRIPVDPPGSRMSHGHIRKYAL